MKIKTKIERMFKKVLDEREAKIIRMRFGLGCEGPYCQSLEEVGQVFHLTRERIRQIESGALWKLQASGELDQFDGYLAIVNNPVAEFLRAEKRKGGI